MLCSHRAPQTVYKIWSCVHCCSSPFDLLCALKTEKKGADYTVTFKWRYVVFLPFKIIFMIQWLIKGRTATLPKKLQSWLACHWTRTPLARFLACGYSSSLFAPFDNIFFGLFGVAVIINIQRLVIYRSPDSLTENEACSCDRCWADNQSVSAGAGVPLSTLHVSEL